MVIYNVTRLKTDLKKVIPQQFNAYNLIFNRDVIFTDADVADMLFLMYTDKTQINGLEYSDPIRYKKHRSWIDLTVRFKLFPYYEKEVALAKQEEADRIAAELAEIERVAKEEAARIEAERIAKEEADRLAKEAEEGVISNDETGV